MAERRSDVRSTCGQTAPDGKLFVREALARSVLDPALFEQDDLHRGSLNLNCASCSTVFVLYRASTALADRRHGTWSEAIDALDSAVRRFHV
eukprot:CAMPEP_0194480698 /NCGR_PEP_ID=MMETSP0253-20130528/3407_1 /TAXON_ID=2966 /ORGANISM="Noctiluca scintillans" /LENGTH=91 /DNA_ID=CAMNT_0039320113 /DNA_START=75 /DNA_END=350 /DNA_ORIENTATION=+